MVRSQAPLPEGITRSISHGRYGEAADALRTLVRREPSMAVLVALADMTFQLGELTEAKENALRAVEAALGNTPRACCWPACGQRWGFENRRRNVTMLFRRTHS